MASNQMSADLLTDGAMIFFAAGLLLTPGFITDAVGLTLLIPPCRKWYKKIVTAYIKRNFKIHVVPMGPVRDDGVVDGEVLDGEVLHPGQPTNDEIRIES